MTPTERADVAPLVVLTTHARTAGGDRLGTASLLAAGAVMVDYFVRVDVTGMDAGAIQDSIDDDIARRDGRRFRKDAYSRQLQLFATQPEHTPVVSRAHDGKGYRVGLLEGGYAYQPGRVQDHPHIRRVNWLGALPPGTRLGGSRNTTVRPVTDADTARFIFELVRNVSPK